MHSKYFWKYVQSGTKTSQGVSPLRTEKIANMIVESDEQKAQVLNDFFSSVFTREDTSNVPSMSTGIN